LVKRGELGDGTTTQRTSPILVPSEYNKDIIKIATGREFSMLLNSKGYVYTFGRGVIKFILIFKDLGALGYGETRDSKQITWPLGVYSNIVDIAAGEYHSLILTDNGRIYSFGQNNVRILLM
jgi:alpha-tubulin suppressor-like RCC1 family protein